MPSPRGRKGNNMIIGRKKKENVSTTDFGVNVIGENEVDISNKDKAEVLAALYNNAPVQAMSWSRAKPMTVRKARKILKRCTYFDYFHGKEMKISLESNVVDTRLYNRGNGDGAAERAISSCRNV